MRSSIATMHPAGKQGVTLEYRKFQAVRRAILEALAESESLLFKEMVESATARLPEWFRGSPNWYITTVKLDLEARGWIECERKRRQTVRSVFRSDIVKLLDQLENAAEESFLFDTLPPDRQIKVIRETTAGPGECHLQSLIRQAADTTG